MIKKNLIAYVCTGLVVLSLIFPSPARAANNYYVSTSGNDSNPGTLAQPFRTIQEGVNKLVAGDTLYIRGGTYTEAVNITTSGSSSAPITISAYSGETPLLNGGSSIALLSRGGTNYWTIQGLTIQSTNRYTIEIGFWGTTESTNWLIKNNHLYGSTVIKGSYNVFVSNDVSGIYPDGTKYGTYTGQGSGDAGLMDIDGSNHDTFISNKVHDFSNYDGRGIWTQGYTHDNLIEFNTVTNINSSTGLGQSIDLDGAGSVEWNQTILGNTVIGASYVGIQLENVFNSLIENNIVKNTGSSGIIDINYASNVGCPALNTKYSNPYGDTNGNGTCKDEVSYNKFIQNIVTTTGNWGWGYGGIVIWGARGLTIQSNTIYSPSSSGNAGINFQTDAAYADGTIIQDNLIMSGNGMNICSEYSLSIFASNDHNLMFNNNSSNVFATGSGCTGTLYSLSSYQSAFGLGNGSIQANPQFMSTSDFHLTSSSPVIDGGIDIGMTTDIDGVDRPQGAGYDIGVYEYSGAISTSTPVATNTPTVTVTNTPTATLPPTATPTAIYTATPTSISTATATLLPTTTPSAYLTPTLTSIFTATATLLPTTTPSAYFTPTLNSIFTATATLLPTTSPTANFTPTSTLPATLVPTMKPTVTLGPPIIPPYIHLLPTVFKKVSPVNGASNQPSNLSLKWGGSNNAAYYEYCIDTINDKACNTKWVTTHRTTSVNLKGLLPGTYYWQVRATNSLGTTYSGEWWSFIVSPVLGSVNKSAPANGAANQPSSLSLSWIPSSKTANYQYCIDTINDNVCNTTWISTNTTPNVALTGLTPGTYYWQVRARHAMNTTYAYGDSLVWWTFTVSP